MYHVASFFHYHINRDLILLRTCTVHITKDVFFDHELPPGRAAMSATRHPYAMCIVPMLS